MENIAIELSLLHSLSGIQFVKQLEKITQYGGFTLLKGKKTISVNRYAAQSPMFYRQFRKKYEQSKSRTIHDAAFYSNGAVSVKPYSPHSAA